MRSEMLTHWLAPKKWGPPLVAFLGSRLLASAAAWREGNNPFQASTWIRWDSGHYIEIAKTGYEFKSCHAIGYPSPNEWCGNTGWFPGYSLLIRLAAPVFKSIDVAAAAIPPVFYFICLTYLWNRLLACKLDWNSGMTLALAAVFPGFIYFHAAFPISILLYSILLLIHFVSGRQWGKAAFVGFLGAFTYSTGFVASALPIAAHSLSSRPKLNRSMGAVSTTACILSGTLAVLILQWWQTGVVGAFFKVQQKYGYLGHKPLLSLYDELKGLVTAKSMSAEVLIQSQAALVCTWVVLSLGFAAFKKRKELASHTTFHLSSVGAISGIAAFTYWIFPHLLGGQTSFYRSEALALPIVLISPKVPIVVRIVFLSAFLIVGFHMSRMFFKGVLV
jgi:hypothetical protein